MSNVEVLLTRQMVADRIGISVETLKAHRRKGLMPEPDHVIGGKPLWKIKTIDRWDAKRQKWSKDR